MPFENILVAVDFSEPSRKALHYAAELAQKVGANLTILHVYQVPVYPLPDGVILPTQTAITDLFQRVNEALAGWSHEAEAHGAPRVSTRSADGAPWRAIVEAAEAGKHDLVVVGTHGHTGARHFFLGSVAERVVRHATCPVLSVR
jgi:universal stress protein A